MHNLRHFYYQNKEKIWKVVLIIAFLLGIIYFLNGQVAEKTKQNTNTSTNNNISYVDQQNKTYISNQSAISGDSVTEIEVKKINSTISKFLKYCKNGNVEQAYNMLSNDCKEEHYDTIEKFKQNYLKTKFDLNSIYEIEKWINNTYRISISKDLLATGNIKDKEKLIEYVTIVKENSQEKLNINSYIGKRELNKQATKNQIKITAINKKMYMDYETYEFEIENLSSKTIKLDTLQKIGTMHLEDKEGIKYNAYAHEILEDYLEIKTKGKVNINIKFAKIYSSTAQIENIVFGNVILDYLEYQNIENKEEFKDICEVVINI